MGMGVLLPRLEVAADTGHGVTFIDDGPESRISWAELHEDARAMAAVLQARGVGPGDHVGLLGPTSRPLVTALQGIWLAGAAVVPLPLPLRLASLSAFAEQTRSRVRQADMALLVADPALAGFIAPRNGDPPVAPLPDLMPPDRRAEGRYEPPALDPSMLAIIQYTSGSTSDPRGVMLPHDHVCANLDGIVEAAGIGPDDTIVSWLPLYHDMGLIGLLGIPMTIGAEVALASAQRFLSQPSGWPEWLSSFRATVTGAPNFGYALGERAMPRAGDLDLSSLRLGIIGAEPIDSVTVEAFNSAGAPFGLDPGAMFCVYGLAEATLAVTFPKVGRGLATDVVEATALERDGRALPAPFGSEDTRRLPLLGTAIPGLELRIADPPTGAELPGRTVGEIEVGGNSVTPGYYRRPEATAALFRDGWLRTGDLGYVAEGELVVCGRLKDVIIVGGRKVFPQDVERAATDVEGIRAGNAVAFGTDAPRGRERVVVVAETRSENIERLRDEVVHRIRSVVGLSPADVVLVPPGTIPKTSSGKLQRWVCRDRYLADRLVGSPMS